MKSLAEVVDQRLKMWAVAVVASAVVVVAVYVVVVVAAAGV